MKYIPWQPFALWIRLVNPFPLQLSIDYEIARPQTLPNAFLMIATV